ncbi:MAG: hypothetical protein GOV01_00395 [Candidatus Altiarchaeota archaeon]|nr:hypothetical protein [Candidatus Altiarchaeota archaeon]
MKTEHLILAAVMLSALFIRIPYVFQESVWNDETVYMWMGYRILENPLFVFSDHLATNSYGYTISIMTAVLSIVTSTFYASRIATMIAALAGIWFTYLLGKELTNEWGGLAAATLLSVNPFHAFFSVRSLTDVYLASAVSLFAYSATKFYKGGSGKLFGASFIITVLSKVAGILLIPVFFFIWGLRAIKDKSVDKESLSALVVAGGFILLLVLQNWLSFGSPLSFTPGRTSILLTGSIFTGDQSFYLNVVSSLYTLPLFLLSAVGIYFSFKDKKVLGTSLPFFVFFLWFSLIIGEKVPRYVLQTIPLVIVLAIYVVFRIVNELKLPPQSILIVLLLVPSMYAPLNDFVISKSDSYTGFIELGEVVSELDVTQNFSKIYAQSTRQIRAFSMIEYGPEEGKLYLVPKDLSEFENETNILVQLDIWEYTGPSWAYPLTQEKLNAILFQNFSILHIVEREIPTQDGPQNAPVGILLAKW